MLLTTTQRLGFGADSFAEGVPGRRVGREGRRCAGQRLTIYTRRNAGRSVGRDVGD